MTLPCQPVRETNGRQLGLFPAMPVDASDYVSSCLLDLSNFAGVETSFEDFRQPCVSQVDLIKETCKSEPHRTPSEMEASRAGRSYR